MKNLYIEGVQGMGKSTLLNSLSAAMPEYRICREGDYSPIDLAWCTWMTKEEYETVLKCYESIQDEIKKNTVQDGEHFVVSYTKIITDIPNFHKELEKFEIYNGRKTLQELKIQFVLKVIILHFYYFFQLLERRFLMEFEFH